MPTLSQISAVFARAANLTFGGGTATTAVIHREIVEKRRWISGDTFGLAFALARVTPGTNLLALCAGLGWLLRGKTGAVVALLAASVPCTLLAVGFTALFSRLEQSPLAQTAIQGAIAAAVAITVGTCWTIARPYFVDGHRLRVGVIAGAAFALHEFAGLSAIAILVIAAVVGFTLPEKRP